MAASGQASSINSAQHSASLHRQRIWPWRKHVTPLDQVYEHQGSLKHASSSDYDTAPPGYGTESSPYALDWIPSVAIPNPPGVEGDMAIQIRDHEYPQNWPMGYKWGLVAIGALSVLSVTMTSSMMSAAIYDIRKHFPGHTAEMYIMSEYSTPMIGWAKIGPRDAVQWIRVVSIGTGIAAVPDRRRFSVRHRYGSHSVGRQAVIGERGEVRCEKWAIRLI